MVLTPQNTSCFLKTRIHRLLDGSYPKLRIVEADVLGLSLLIGVLKESMSLCQTMKMSVHGIRKGLDDGSSIRNFNLEFDVDIYESNRILSKRIVVLFSDSNGGWIGRI